MIVSTVQQHNYTLYVLFKYSPLWAVRLRC